MSRKTKRDVTWDVLMIALMLVEVNVPEDVKGAEVDVTILVIFNVKEVAVVNVKEVVELSVVIVVMIVVKMVAKIHVMIDVVILAKEAVPV